MQKITIGTRGSELALWQAHFTRDLLEKLGVEVELKIIKTQGDAIQHLSFDKMEGKGFFTKEIEAELLNGNIDLAVHSHKDLETSNLEGLTVAAVSYRENPVDTLLIRPESVDQNGKFLLKENAIVGTSSARRKSQLLTRRPDIQLKDLRGNVPTRINKLLEGQYDAIVLAKAGLSRIKVDTKDLVIYDFNPTEFVPAPAQGVLGWQCRDNDERVLEILSKIHHPEIQETIAVERKVLNLLEGGCQMPLGCFCVKENDTFKVQTAFSTAWNEPCDYYVHEAKSAEGLAEQIISDLKKKA